MNWSLFLSDALARVIGLLGLVASAAWIAGTAAGWSGIVPATAFGIGSALFCLMMTVFYLIPAFHDRMMRRTLHGLARAGFRVLGGAWCVVLVAGLFLAGAALDGVLAFDLAQRAWPIPAALAVTAAMVLIYPGNLAWRQPQAERDAAAMPGADGTEAGSGAQDGGASPDDDYEDLGLEDDAA